jgi:thiamine biosynthesis lipoprotein
MGITDTVSEINVARRAMACEFSVVFPNWVRFAADAGYAALDEVERFEQKLSIYIEDSDLSRINRNAAARPVAADADVYAVLRAAVQLNQETQGTYDAAAGALVKTWGFFRGPKRVPTDQERLAALASSGSRYVRLSDPERTIQFLRPGVEFNLGGIGKGYAIDRALSLIARQYRVRSALMQGGQSSLRAIGSPSDQHRGWAVDIGHPAVARVRLRDLALGTSGAANQFFVVDGKRYGHVLDPRTGWPARKLIAASAIARTATEADALSTAFFVLGLEGTREFISTHPETTAVLVVPGKTAPEVVVIGDADVEVLR